MDQNQHFFKLNNNNNNNNKLSKIEKIIYKRERLKMRDIKIILMLAMFLFVVGCVGTQTGDAVESVSSNDEPQIVKIGLNRDGFTTSVSSVEVNREVILMNDGTLGGCGLYVVQPELGINANFGRSDTYSFTPTETGSFTYTCSMGMYKGTLKVI